MTKPENENQSYSLSDGCPNETPLLDSMALFADRNEILIQHNGQIYRLRATKNGKLVMNK